MNSANYKQGRSMATVFKEFDIKALLISAGIFVAASSGLSAWYASTNDTSFVERTEESYTLYHQAKSHNVLSVELKPNFSRQRYMELLTNVLSRDEYQDIGFSLQCSNERCLLELFSNNTNHDDVRNNIINLLSNTYIGEVNR
jgi:flagellar basal body-associated protein FliL